MTRRQNERLLQDRIGLAPLLRACIACDQHCRAHADRHQRRSEDPHQLLGQAHARERCRSKPGYHCGVHDPHECLQGIFGDSRPCKPEYALADLAAILCGQFAFLLVGQHDLACYDFGLRGGLQPDPRADKRPCGFGDLFPGFLG